MPGFRLLLLVAIGFLLVGCGRPMRTVNIQVLRTDRPAEEGGAIPLHGAHVRAIPMGMSPVPIPVSGKNLSDAKIASGPGGYTDRHGVVSFRLVRDTGYTIDVAPPPFGDLAEAGRWRWVLDSESAILRDGPESSVNQPGITALVLP